MQVNITLFSEKRQWVFLLEMGHLLGLIQYSRRWTFLFRNNSKNLDTSYYSGSDFVGFFSCLFEKKARGHSIHIAIVLFFRLSSFNPPLTVGALGVQLPFQLFKNL